MSSLASKSGGVRSSARTNESHAPSMLGLERARALEWYHLDFHPPDPPSHLRAVSLKSLYLTVYFLKRRGREKKKEGEDDMISNV